MRSADQTRRYEVLIGEDWTPTHWEYLDVGDRVRQFEPGVTNRWLEFTVDRHPSLSADDLFDPAIGHPGSEYISNVVSPATFDEPTADGTDMSHPAYWRGHDDAVLGMCVRIAEILDGTDTGIGACNSPWRDIRNRLIELVKDKHGPSR